MPDFVTKIRLIERRTYVKGIFKGKFIGYLDYKKSDIKHENFYDIEVLSGEIYTNKSNFRNWKEGDEFEEFISVEKFLTKLPESIPCTVTDSDGNISHYKINLNEPKLSYYQLTNQHYENENIFGTIEGEISGYLKHYDKDEYQEELIPGDDESSENKVTGFKIKTDKQTGSTEKNGNYKRWEYFYDDYSTYWSDWKFQTKKSPGGSFWGLLIGLLQLLFFAIVIIPILIAGWQVILPLIVLASVFYLLSILQPILIFIWKWLMRLFGFAFVLFFILGIISLFRSSIHVPTIKKKVIDDNKEVSQTKPGPEIIGDSIISHHRIWQDYENKTYSGNLEVRVSDFKGSNNFRNNLSYSVQDPSQYNFIVSLIYDFDKNKLGRIYVMLDSLKTTNQLDNIQFAKVITSCIQDIPYTLILDNACNASQYNDDFIRNYLRNGGRCEGYVKFGILTPIEFMGSLEGDCDTRTLLLFAVLNHYNYDVAMLGSELFKHSVIGINLPLYGVSKTINGKQYFIWETTEPGLEPGFFPRELSDMRFWNVNLISNPQAI